MTKQANTEKNAIIYARQSYGAEVNSLSVEQQIERCKAWATRNGITVEAVYCDNNTSSELYPDSEKGHAYCATDRGWQRWYSAERSFKGRKKYRKGLAEAFEHIEAHHVEFFIVDENTRLYRNPSATAQLDTFCIVTLQEAKTALVNVTTNTIDRLENNVNIAIWRALATYEMEKVNEKAKAARLNRKRNTENGNVYSNAFGIDWISKKIHYNSEKMEVVKYIFSSVLAHKTYSEILFTLNSTYKQYASGKSYYESNIYSILHNPVYSGYRKLDDGRYVKINNLDNVPPISFVLFQKANEIALKKAETSGKQKYNVKNQARRNFLPLSGLLICGHCGKRLTMVPDDGIVYFCKNTIYTHDKECTPSRIRSNFDIDNNDLLIVFQPLFLLKLYQSELQLRQLNNSTSEIDRLTADIESQNNRIKAVYSSAIRNGIDLALIEDEIQKAKAEIIEKTNTLASLKATKDKNYDTELEKLNNLRSIIQADVDTLTLLPQDDYSRLLRETIKAITVYSDNIAITLFDGNTFELPRIKYHRRTKGLPFATAQTYVNVQGWAKHYITYTINPNGKETTLIDTKYYNISIKQ